MKALGDMTLENLLKTDHNDCACGRAHAAGLAFVRIGRDAVQSLPEALDTIGCHKPFIVCDINTANAALGKVQAVLDAENRPYTLYQLTQTHVEPDEQAVGSLCMAFDPTCDGVLAVGSGVINDCCKIVARVAKVPQAVVATAPSMDGYASNSSSMIRNKVMVTLYNACPAAIIADTLILKDAPERMLQAGLGDMLAKSIALCEWRISHIVTGEYYCEEVAGLMRASLAKIMQSAPRLLTRDPEVIGAVMEGLILSGVAMAYAQISRPASGLEHYFSHLWEMFALERGLPMELHGIQVGVGTLLSLRIYDRLRRLSPNRAAAERSMLSFDPAAWESNMRRVFGQTAQILIDSENQLWHKNDPIRHQERLNRILDNWDAILQIIDEELPDTDVIYQLMQSLGMPLHPHEIGQSDRDTRDAFYCSRDIRDKYMTSSLLWDLGWLDDFPLQSGQ